jgi:hypothetical protein
MPTVVIRPDGTTSQTGWSVASNIHSVIGDNDVSTSAEQTSTTCDATVTLSNTSGISSLDTINSITVSYAAVAGRLGSADLTIKIIDSGGSAFGQQTQTVTSDAIYTNTAVTTQSNGSALTVTYVDGLSILIAPDNAGITLKEISISVDYTEFVPPPTYNTTINRINVTGGSIKLTSGNVRI